MDPIAVATTTKALAGITSEIRRISADAPPGRRRIRTVLSGALLDVPVIVGRLLDVTAQLVDVVGQNLHATAKAEEGVASLRDAVADLTERIERLEGAGHA